MNRLAALNAAMAEEKARFRKAWESQDAEGEALSALILASLELSIRRELALIENEDN